MKITVLQENLLSGLKIAQKGLARKPQLPILAAFLLKVEDSTLTISATDLFIGVTTSVLGAETNDGTIAVLGKQFYDIVNALPAGKLQLELDDTQLKITSKTSKSTLQVLPADEFPDFPTRGDQHIELETAFLEEVISEVGFASSSDETRPVLTSILFKFDDPESEIVATDGFRLVVFKTKTAFPQLTLQIPQKALKEVQRITSLVSAEKIDLYVSEELKQLTIVVGDVTMFVRLIDGEYPPYNKIIPADFAVTGTFDAEQFASLLKAIQVFAREGSNVVNLSLTADQVELSATTPSLGTHTSSLVWEPDGQVSGQIAFNVTYLADFLSQVKPQTVWFGMNDSLQPAVLKPIEKSEYQYLVMPFKLNQ